MIIAEVYIGVKEKCNSSNGNINIVWVQCDDGLFRSTNSDVVLSKEHIEWDVLHKFLKRIN